MPYPGWDARRVRQYKHILESTGSKKEAASVVNKERRQKGELKKRKASN